jgi:hypothetical protein
VLEGHGVGEAAEEGLGDLEEDGEVVKPAVGKDVSKGVCVNDGETDAVANGVWVWNAVGHDVDGGLLGKGKPRMFDPKTVTTIPAIIATKTRTEVTSFTVVFPGGGGGGGISSVMFPIISLEITGIRFMNAGSVFRLLESKPVRVLVKAKAPAKPSFLEQN